MARMLPDPTFYPSPKMASEAPRELLAYVALLTNGQNGKKDALGVVDTDPESADYGRLVGQLDFPDGGNELHHFGWNACSSHLVRNVCESVNGAPQSVNGIAAQRHL
jgi:selenium-binding protein 1